MEKNSDRSILKSIRRGIGLCLFMPLFVGWVFWIYVDSPIELGFLNRTIYLLAKVRSHNPDHCIFCAFLEMIRWVAVFIMAIGFSLIFPKFNWKSILLGVLCFFVAINGRVVAYSGGAIAAKFIKSPQDFKIVFADENKYKIPYDYFRENKDKKTFITLYQRIEEDEQIASIYKEIVARAKDIKADGVVFILGQTKEVMNYSKDKYGKDRVRGKNRVVAGDIYLKGNPGNKVYRYLKDLKHENENSRLVAINNISEIDHKKSEEILLGLVKDERKYNENGYLDYMYALDGLSKKRNEEAYPKIMNLSYEKNGVGRAIRMLSNYPDDIRTVIRLNQIFRTTENQVTKIRAYNALKKIEQNRNNSKDEVADNWEIRGNEDINIDMSKINFVHLTERDYRDRLLRVRETNKYLEYGRHFYGIGEYEKAIAGYREVITESESEIDKMLAYKGLANSFEKIGDFDNALKAFIIWFDEYLAWQPRELLHFRIEYLYCAAKGEYEEAFKIAERGFKEYSEFYNHRSYPKLHVDLLENLKSIKHDFLNLER